MPTREQVHSIEARINPRVQMIYVKPPYTSHLDDAKLLSADSAEATQKTLVKEAQLAKGIQEHSPFLLHSLSQTAVPGQPEQDTGHIISTKG